MRQFGLVDMSSNPLPSFSNLDIISEDDDTASTAATTSLGSNASISQMSTTSGSSASTQSTSTQAGTTNVETLPPLPTSLRQAKLILENRAHVNMVDYVAARKTAKFNARKGKLGVHGQAKNFAHLVHPSKRALIKYTQDTEKIYPRQRAKNEWLAPMLEPLLGYHHKAGRR